MRRAVFLIALIAGLTACTGQAGPMPIATIDPRPISFTEARLEYESQETVRGPITFMDFYAEWCVVCKETTPLVERLRQEFGNTVLFVSYDIDAPASRDVVRQHRVVGVPTFVILDSQQNVIARFTGGFEYADMKRRLQRYLGQP
jgi:thiol-disulfide isomerase/thioredoxin